VVDALAAEQAARSREELNALYVALTRTQQTLVLSSVEPRSAQGGSWWSRLAPYAQAVAVEAPVRSNPTSPATTCVLPVLPEIPEALRWAHRTAERQAGETAIAEDSLESRIGQAMHRLLEWLPTLAGGYGQSGQVPAWSAAQRELVGQHFDLDAEQVTQAVSMAQAIACGEGTWAWDANQLQWSSNEVALGSGGRLLRLDRLVQRRADGIWWVLDYKSHSAPHLDADLCAQLQGYRAAVQKAHNGQTVCAAFLTALGALIELKTP
jgi:ATP-dependent helicase/nuclease subunit A